MGSSSTISMRIGYDTALPFWRLDRDWTEPTRLQRTCRGIPARPQGKRVWFNRGKEWMTSLIMRGVERKSSLMVRGERRWPLPCLHGRRHLPTPGKGRGSCRPAPGARRSSAGESSMNGIMARFRSQGVGTHPAYTSGRTRWAGLWHGLQQGFGAVKRTLLEGHDAGVQRSGRK